MSQNYVNFLGIGVDAITYEDLFERVDQWIENKNGRSHHIACVNAYNVALSLTNKQLYRIYNNADVTGADGIPFVKWIRRIKKMSCDRIAAPDTILQLAKHAYVKKYTFYLYGGSPEVCINMKLFLEEKFPHINIVGYYSPPFRLLTDQEEEFAIAEINRLKPDIVCVGLGTPKQDYWIDTHLDIIKGSVLIASGATFDFFGGRIKMAPDFIRNSGFEWLFRLLGKDFKRLWKRYILMYSLFMAAFVLQKCGLINYEVIKNKHI